MLIDLIIRYAPVKINPDPPTLGFVGLWWSFITILAGYQVCGGVALFVAFALRNVGHWKGIFVLIAIAPARTNLGTFWHIGVDTSVHRYLWNPFYCYSNQYID